MAVAFGSIATATVSETGTANSLTITKPASLAAGDLMLAIFGYSGNTAEWALTGWTSALATSDTSARVLNVLLKVATSGDASASDFTFTISGGEPNNVCGAILRITGSAFAGTANVVATDSDTSGAQNPSYSGGVTPGAANTLLIMGAVAGGSVTGVTTGSYAVVNDNPTWTERADLTETGGASNDILLAIATATFSVGTATGNYSLSFSADPGDSIGFLLSINETTNVTVSPTVITSSLNVQAPTVSGGATVTVGSTLSIVLNIVAPTVSAGTAKWSNTDKSSAPTYTNTDKS